MIRSFQADDIEQIIDIWLAASIEAHDFIAPSFWRSQADDMRNIYVPNAETYVYADRDTIRGFFCLREDSLAALFVAPAYQGQGIGRRLMEEALQRRRDLTLTVYKQNRKSIRFYQGCGFEQVAEKIDEHTGHAALVMAQRG
ncbi:N-acetyltransferase [Alkalilimnicola ehrlichii]|uniref:N-acetyltransferase n=1 Tax=Alkalilimnicola ehrlichii TaxID=351052 RepID=A0A3E0WXR9_9GAMM|nr:N-acetyltransferase [Alkalilimnicola ehrlichii]RFA29303.1 N-acetyltransferase [Alkalilimnicola ehrlichii]RFA36816.1 N-acetyltransferase [Alkalilimnicola ehrlichii]